MFGTALWARNRAFGASSVRLVGQWRGLLSARRFSLLFRAPIRPTTPSLVRQLRFNTTAAKTAPIPAPEAPKKSPPNVSVTSEIHKLLRLGRPELGLLVAAFICLVVTSTVSMLLPLIIGKVLDTAKEDDTKIEDVKIFGFAMNHFYAGVAVLFVIAGITNFSRMYLLRSVGERLVARLRSRLFAKILSQDQYFFDVGPSNTGMKTGDLISRLASDTQVIAKTLSGNISDGARALISGVVGTSMMCYVSWKLTLCMTAVIPPLVVLLTVYGRRIKQLSRTIQENLGEVSKVTEENLNGLRTIQSFAQQNKVVHSYNKEVRKLFNTSLYEGRLSAIFFSFNGIVGNFALVLLLAVGTRLIAHGDMTVGDLSSFMLYAVYTGSSVYGVSNFYTELMKGVGASQRVFEAIEIQPRIPTSLGKKVDLLHGDVEFRNITFRYPSRPDTEVLRRFNITIKKGEHVCFVGPSGSGKSTVSQLLLRFYDPQEGTVVVNGHNIRDLNLNFYRANIGYVQQEPLLFSGTIRDNVTFGKPDASDAEIEWATRLSNAYDFVQGFPAGLDTEIGPSSSGLAQLSGGQKQRLSLARTLIKKPDILILDEATSALDLRLEEIVTRNLQQLAGTRNMTIILIAHRLLTIKNSKRVVVLDGNGAIVEDGDFELLFADQGSQLNRLLKNIDVE